MTGKLEAALSWARRGFRVFPLQENSKDPLDIAWTLHATTDESVIRNWWTDPVLGCERDFNIGFLTTDWVVPDVDVKRGKPGLETMMSLGLGFDTLTTRTPTGGYHLVYRGLATPVGGSPLGPGVDVRSHNGYVVAPGSTIDGVAYEVEIDQPVVEFPEHLRSLLKAPRRRAEVLPADVELDAPETVELVAHWLLHDAQPAVEGLNGDDTTYRVCCRMRDFGISEAQALELFLDEYNGRCEPPWSPEEAALKIENAYRYATGSAGHLSPAAVFGDVVQVAPVVASAEAPQPGVGLARYGNMLLEADIEQRPWVLYGLLELRKVTMLNAPGGAGKSLLSLIVAAHLAVGRDFLGCRCVRPGKSVIYNAEDDLEEMSRRLIAVMALYNLDPAVVVPRVALVSGDEVELRVTKGAPPEPHVIDITRISEACADPECVLFSLDPLVELHTGRENDPGDMRNVMGIFRKIARAHDTAILIVAHTGKMSTDPDDQMSARGSSAIPNLARVVLNLTVAKETDCMAIGAPAADYRSYVRLDGAKASALAAKDRATARWLRWETHWLSNGDGVGVLLEHDAVTASADLVRAIGQVFSRRLLADGSASYTLDEAVAVAAAAGFHVSRADLPKMYANAVQVDGHTVQYRTDADGAKRAPRIVVR